VKTLTFCFPRIFYRLGYRFRPNRPCKPKPKNEELEIRRNIAGVGQASSPSNFEEITATPYTVFSRVWTFRVSYGALRIIAMENKLSTLTIENGLTPYTEKPHQL